jgi:hypothetical protein
MNTSPRVLRAVVRLQIATFLLLVLPAIYLLLSLGALSTQPPDHYANAINGKTDLAEIRGIVGFQLELLTARVQLARTLLKVSLIVIAVSSILVAVTRALTARLK